ncbi:MAG: hypothetical protein KBS60_00825 [Phascolarctobacterium sp.]|nr:hypothetical protein [Candidatus Phascolarctobacterium caballi]
MGKILSVLMGICLAVVIWESPTGEEYVWKFLSEYKWIGANTLQFKDWRGTYTISGGLIMIEEDRNF